MTASATTEAIRPHPGTVRLHGLDILRGLCAMGVAIYHFRLWSGFSLGPLLDGALAVLGTYGVSVFFVLSGFSLAHAYQSVFADAVREERLVRYLKRRIGRLAPLYISVALASLAGKLLFAGHVPDGFTLLANLTLTFGFWSPASSIVIGGWSIGIEIVLYILFPLLILARARWVWIIAFSGFLTLWISWDLSAMPDLAAGWADYASTANQLIFFAAGVFMRVHGERLAMARRLVLPVVLAVPVVVFLLAAGVGELQLVSGWRRPILIGLSLLLVAAASGETEARRFPQLSNILGGISYPLYLVHPLLFMIGTKVLATTPVTLIMLFLVAIIAAIVVDRLVDAPTQRRLKANGW